MTQEQRGDEERVVAYDPRSGRPLWSHGDPARYSTVIAGTGPRATPLIEGGRVYALGATGLLNALDLASGRALWAHDVVRETGAMLPDWGKSARPPEGRSWSPRGRGTARGVRRRERRGERLVRGRRRQATAPRRC